MTVRPKIAAKHPIMFKVEKDKEYFYCTCGYSKDQPMCDGAHKNTSFKPMVFKSSLTTDEALCTCKRSRIIPYCDGSHNKL